MASFPVTEAGSGDSQVYREVYALYEQLLGRDPDPGGFAFWTGTGGAALGQMADAFLTSPEAFNHDFVVMAAYQAATGAPPTFAQYNAAVTSIRAGTQTVTALFNSLTGAGYSASTLYQNLLGRAATSTEINDANQAGLANWFQTLIGYPGSVTPMSTPNNEFQSTGTYQTDHTNTLYVQLVYYVTLTRDPDPGGLAFWVGVAGQGGPGHRRPGLYRKPRVPRPVCQLAPWPHRTGRPSRAAADPFPRHRVSWSLSPGRLRS